ncbi:Hep_Hag repeat-containing protein [Neobacillus vireti LMG 21834]|uniref:Hep_Hag repeat-containing protein n=1 Tax=Neobacillus vireti LMG 21834 TaxID=1131730 RepID=A0AB94IFD4_9BACI|nr:Hep_Hag repeat-containing protein [Neobacillus vireti LMG 21834]
MEVGLIGQILVHDDGTCKTHGYCWANDEGIATTSDKGYFVLKRTGENQILILVK